ncbi:MAG: hypothetical protein KAI79_17545 [Bacteroidales bacterium]|nr:hypothetical protein [Bacteroidales bacterium]
MYNTIKETGEWIITLNNIKETESAYKEAQKFLNMCPSTYNIEEMKKFIKEYLRNR